MRELCVVDTNVAIVANGGADHVSVDCMKRCIDELERLCRDGVVYVDREGLIVDEYFNRLTPKSFGVGNAFFKLVFDNQWTEKKVRQVHISPNHDANSGFDELPPNNLDRADRKFLAVAFAAKASILNATDSDWSEHKELTDKLGVRVKQICPSFAAAPAGK